MRGDVVGRERLECRAGEPESAASVDARSVSHPSTVIRLIIHSEGKVYALAALAGALAGAGLFGTI